jgi:hypothetical protein
MPGAAIWRRRRGRRSVSAVAFGSHASACLAGTVGNHFAIPRSFEFTIARYVVELNGHSFELEVLAGRGRRDDRG